MFTYADQVGKKFKEDKITKNIKNVYLRKPGWKKLKKTKCKKYKKCLLSQPGWQKKSKKTKYKKNIKTVYLCTSGWKKSKKTKYKNIYIKSVYIRRTGWQKSYRSLKFVPNPPKRPDLAEFGTLVAPRGKKIFAICLWVRTSLPKGLIGLLTKNGQIKI